MRMLAPTGRAPIFYGWWIFAAGFATRAINGALFFHVLGTYVELLGDEFGWSLAALSVTGGAAGGLLEPIVVPALEEFGWRSGAFVSGLLIIAIGVPLAAAMRHRPEDHGYRIDGGPRNGEAAHEAPPEELNFTARQALRTRAFWFLAMGNATAVAAFGSVSVHFVVYSHDPLDLSLRAIAFVIPLLGVSAVVGLLGGGYLADRTNKRPLIACALLGLAIGVMALALASAYWMLIVFAALAGIGSGALRPTLLAMLADYFGGKAIGTIMGFSSLLMVFAWILGPVFVGVVHDMTGSYRGAFLVLACAAVVGSLLFWLAVKPTLPDTAEAGTADAAPA